MIAFGMRDPCREPNVYVQSAELGNRGDCSTEGAINRLLDGLVARLKTEKRFIMAN